MKFSKNDMINYAAILVIAVSLASIGMQLTGFATVSDTAIVNVTVDTSAAISFTTSFIDFLNGSVNTSLGSVAVLDTEGTATVNGSWGTTATGFILENIGNTNVSLAFSSSANASVFLGGSNPEFKFKVNDDIAGTACVGPTAVSYTEINETPFTACTAFPFTTGDDQLSVDIQLTIPADSNVGNLTATVTATGTFS